MVVSFSSTTIKRVRTATLQAENTLQNAQEVGDRDRALLAQLCGHASDGLGWHEASRRAVLHVMHSDCRSLVSLEANLNTEVLARVQDKRLHIQPRANQPLMTTAGLRARSTHKVETELTGSQIADCLANTQGLGYCTGYPVRVSRGPMPLAEDP